MENWFHFKDHFKLLYSCTAATVLQIHWQRGKRISFIMQIRATNFIRKFALPSFTTIYLSLPETRATWGEWGIDGYKLVVEVRTTKYVRGSLSLQIFIVTLIKIDILWICTNMQIGVLFFSVCWSLYINLSLIFFFFPAFRVC